MHYDALMHYAAANNMDGDLFRNLPMLGPTGSRLYL